MRITLTDEEYEKLYDDVNEELKKILKKRKEEFEKSITDKLRNGTKKASEKKVNTSIQKVKNAIRILKMEKKEINANRIAKVANINYATARKYYNKIKEESLLED